MYWNEGLGFRLPETTDLESMRMLRNDPSTWMHLSDPWLITEEGQKRWFQSLSTRSDRLYFVVWDSNRPFVGIVRLDEIDRTNRSMRVGTDVVPELRGKGYGHRIMQNIKRYCFDTLNMHRLWLAVLATNVRAHHLYQRQGFVEEGRYREAIFRDGKYVDYVIMSILEEEYRR